MAHMPHIVVVWCVLLPHSVPLSVCECDCVSCKELPDEDEPQEDADEMKAALEELQAKVLALEEENKRLLSLPVSRMSSAARAVALPQELELLDETQEALLDSDSRLGAAIEIIHQKNQQLSEQAQRFNREKDLMAQNLQLREKDLMAMKALIDAKNDHLNREKGPMAMKELENEQQTRKIEQLQAV